MKTRNLHLFIKKYYGTHPRVPGKKGYIRKTVVGCFSIREGEDTRSIAYKITGLLGIPSNKQKQ